jgi:hypothetical protein
MHSSSFDTSWERKGVFAALAKEDDTRSFYRWLERAFERPNHHLKDALANQQLWTIFGQ